MMRRATTLSALATSFTTTCFLACSSGQTTSEFPQAGTCPEGAEQIAQMDWGLEEPTAAKVRAGLLASQHLELLAVVYESDLLDTCTALAEDLYATGKQLEAEDHEIGAEALKACDVAAESLSKLLELSGGELSINLEAAVCLIPMTAASECFKACTPEGSIPKLECQGESSGACDGSCTGQCSIENASSCGGSCSGICTGSCDSEFEGECRSKCEGTCDGKKSKAECQGLCKGRCMEAARGNCGGVCMGSCDGGSCTIEAMGICEGLCSGSCDQPLVDEKCQGIVVMPESTNECHASCETLVLAETQCSDVDVTIKIEDAENQDAADHLQQALLKHLPLIFAASALSADADKVNTAVERTTAAIAAMNEALANPELTLDSAQKSCVQKAVEAEGASTTALNLILQAADSARVSMSGE